MIWGGAGAKAEKKLNGYSRRKKKTQLNNPERLVAEQKKTQREFSARGRPSDH